jgi:hypothetical protein
MTHVVARSKPEKNTGREWFSSAMGCLFGHFGHTVTSNFDAALEGKTDYYVWTGRAFGESGGGMFIPALFRSADLRAVALAVQARKQAEGKSCNFGQAQDLVRKYHSGLGASKVALSVCAYTEIDHIPIKAQLRAYRALMDATGLRWALIVYSGGKSLHAYLSFSRPLLPDDPLRLEIQKLLAVALGADTKIVDAGRLMRTPAYAGEERPQPVMHLDDSANYEPVDIRDTLLAYVQGAGIVDAESAYKDLQLAEEVTREQKKRPSETAKTLAWKLRHERGRLPDDSTRDAALAFLGRGAGAFTAANCDLSKFAGARAGKVVAPCCTGDDAQREPAGSVMVGADGAVKGIYCQRHKVWHREAPALPEGKSGEGFRMFNMGAEAKAEAAPEKPKVAPFTDAEKFSYKERAAHLCRMARVEARRAEAHWRPLELRVEARRAEAQGLDLELVRGALTAKELGQGWAEALRAQFVEEGAEEPGGPCGSLQALGEVETHALAAHRRSCKSRHCFWCAPDTFATQSAALAWMPQAGGGEPLARRKTVFRQVVPAENFDTWKRGFNRMSRNRLFKDVNKKKKDDSGTCSAYAGFLAGEMWTVFSTLEHKLKGAPKPERVKDVEDAIRVAMLKTFHAEKLPNRNLKTSGKITSSRGLIRDVDRIWHLASGSKWVVEARWLRGEIEFVQQAAWDLGIESQVYSAGLRLSPKDTKLRQAFLEKIALPEPDPAPSVVLTPLAEDDDLSDLDNYLDRDHVEQGTDDGRHAQGSPELHVGEPEAQAHVAGPLREEPCEGASEMHTGQPVLLSQLPSVRPSRDGPPRRNDFGDAPLPRIYAGMGRPAFAGTGQLRA